MAPLLSLVLALGVTLSTSTLGTDAALAVRRVPGSEGAVVFAEPGTRQAVVADLDGDGAREVVRLLQDGDRLLVDVLGEERGTFEHVGEIEVVAGGETDTIGERAPARLVVHAEGPRERVVLVRQPPFEPPGLEAECCLELHEVEVIDGELRLRPVGGEREAVDSVLALDLDGDGTDELLASRSLPPLGRTAYPSQQLVYSWDGERFGEPVVTDLPIGSGDTPFVLGDTDGLPGEEAAVITRAARSHLFRLVPERGGGGTLFADPAGVAVRDAVSVPFGTAEAGVAVVTAVNGLTLHRWPSNAPLDAPIAQRELGDARLLGAVALADGPILVIDRPDSAPEALVHPGLDAAGSSLATPAAALARTATSLAPYRGPVPGGGPNGRPAVLVDGVLLEDGGEPLTAPAMAGARPVGFAGADRGWLVVHHVSGLERIDPAGGRLEPLGPLGIGPLSLVPADVEAWAEADDGRFDPPLIDATALDDRGSIGVTAHGFRAVVEGPPGSVVHHGVGLDGRELGVEAIPDDGPLEVHLPLPRTLLPYAGEAAWIVVVTPAGASYTATWNVIGLIGAPTLGAAARTRPGSTAVEVSGQTLPYATVTVGGRPVDVDAEGRFHTSVELPPWPTDVPVRATDPAGNEATVVVTGIGLLDYRDLPWAGISLVLVAAAAIVLYRRVPARARRAPDVAAPAFEELDPDEKA